MLRNGLILTRRQKYLMIKFFALLSMVRWYNILAMMIALYLSAVFLLNPEQSKLAILLDYKLHFNIFGLGLIIMSGYIMNSFYDLEKDLVNKPNETIFDRIVSKRFSFNCYFAFNTLGLSLSFFVGWKVLALNIAFASALWFYSHKLRKIPGVGEFSAATLTIVPFVSLSLYYFHTTFAVILYVGFLFMIELTREIVKKLEAMKGDIIYDHGSLPIMLGVKNAKMVIYFLMIATAAQIVYLHPTVEHNYYILGYLGTTIVLIIIALILLIGAGEQRDFRRVNLLYKLIITGGILCVALI